ncbi:MAG: HD domain-containing protein [Acidobacteriia bacterium]|nr:HD domain-containing protein [Terriglobia bacterium]
MIAGKTRSSLDGAASISPDQTREAFFRSGEASEVLTNRMRWVDGVVAAAYEQFLAPAYPREMALLAVGGYGRKELFPESDIDLLLLTGPEPPAGRKKEALSAFLQHLWDADLRLSHSVRTVKECCDLHEGNIELNVSLLDQRYLTGDEALYQELTLRLPKFLQGNRQSLARHLCRLTRERHAKFHGTIYHLEPNIKETPGGLRDLQLIHWLGLVDESVTAETLDELRTPERFLHSLRCFLHYRTGRDNNLLSFDAQEEVTEQDFLPFHDPSHSMREYYRNSRAIHRAALRAMEAVESRNNSLLAGFRDWRTRLSNNEFTVSREKLLLKSPHQLETDPDMTLRLFKFVARHKVPLHAESERRIRQYLPVLVKHFQREALSKSPQVGSRPGEGANSGSSVSGAGTALCGLPIWPELRHLLGLPNASYGLRAMHETGVLSAIFPDWSQIECYVVRDFHHKYTVDEHTLITIENLEHLGVSKDPARARFTGLLNEIESTAVLKLALLFHDVGKGRESESHSIESRMLAEKAALRIGMPELDRQMLLFLIENHLLLSSAMNSRDLGDPQTAQWLAHKVVTLERLKLLTLMTFCDIGAVNPTALSPWRMAQLWRVYFITYRELTRELDSERIHSTAFGLSEELAQDGPRPGLCAPELQRFLEGFPTRYLRIHTEAEVREHFALEEQRQSAGTVVDIRKREGVYHLTVLTKDRPRLFAAVAGALASFAMNIVKAEAFANAEGTVLDTFAFSDPLRTLDLNPSEADSLRKNMERVVTGRAEVKALLKNRPMPTLPSKGSRIAGRITFDNDVSDNSTLVEVVAEDRPGLLYDLATAFSEAGCNIEVVLVDTEAHRALDVFYVTSAGGKLTQELQTQLQSRLLAACEAAPLPDTRS